VAPHTTVLLEKPNLRMRAEHMEDLSPEYHFEI
jgi:hypothetical protein